MSELRSIVESLQSEALADLPDARLEEDFSELHRAVELLEAERLRRLAEIDRRGLVARDGYLSTTAWLAHTQRMTWGSARMQTRMARALDEMPLAIEAIRRGEVSWSAASVLVDARTAHPEAFREAEPTLVDAARRLGVCDLQKAVAYWRQRVEASLEGGARAFERRRLHASVSFMGMVRVDGDLDPENGETLLTALGAVLDAEARGRTEEDTRSPAQRRADALGEICRQWLDRKDRPTVAGERPHVTLTIAGEALHGRDGATRELDHVGPVDAATAERLLCDSSVMRMVMSADSQPLDVGRRTPVWPPAIRRAVVARDRHCRFPGCDRPPVQCDVHHIVTWSRGGPTSLEDGILLCRRHHRLVHEPGGFGLAFEDDVPVFRRPDGTRLEERAPP